MNKGTISHNQNAYESKLALSRLALHKKKVPQIKESPFLGKATMTYSMGLPEPEKNYGVDLSTFWES